MILSKTVFVKISPSNIQHYKKLNYNPIFGSIIEVKTEHLPKNSHIKVLCKCDNCAKEKLISYRKITKLCKSCFNKSDKHLQFIQKIGKNNKGKHYLDETRKLMSNLRKGKLHTTETKNKMSKNSWHRKHSGILSPNYNINLTNKERIRNKYRQYIIGYYQYINKVLKRDNYTCQKCGSHEYLQVHHILNFANFKELRTKITNGITLCFDCHKAKNGKSIHNVYGRYPNKEQFYEFMNNHPNQYS